MLHQQFLIKPKPHKKSPRKRGLHFVRNDLIQLFGLGQRGSDSSALRMKLLSLIHSPSRLAMTTHLKSW